MKFIMFISAIVMLYLTISCGKDGVPGRNGKDGVGGINGIQGPAGQNGGNGSNGIDGLQGPPGEDGESITVIQFCPGVVSSYPTSFPEVGFKINGKIYAVFSSGGNAGLVELVPGTYITTTTGLACTFIVKAGGEIEN
jgi:hypothetical protein